MEIILQDKGHVSLFLVDVYLPEQGLHFSEGDFLSERNPEVVLDKISFRPTFYSCRWFVKDIFNPDVFFRTQHGQITKMRGSEAKVRDVWSKGRAMAAYVAFNLPSHRPAEGSNIRNDFNCCTGVIACLRGMGLSLDGLVGDAGTQYDFSQIGLDF